MCSMHAYVHVHVCTAMCVCICVCVSMCMCMCLIICIPDSTFIKITNISLLEPLIYLFFDMTRVLIDFFILRKCFSCWQCTTFQNSTFSR